MELLRLQVLLETVELLRLVVYSMIPGSGHHRGGVGGKFRNGVFSRIRNHMLTIVIPYLELIRHCTIAQHHSI